MFVVEPARGEDAVRLARLAHDSLPEGYDAPWWNARLAANECVVARDFVSQRVIGFAVGEPEPACDGHVAALAVDWTQRGTGVGSALLRNVQANLRRSGSYRVHIEVRADDREAQDFYRRHGYQVDGLLDGAYRDGSSALRMSRPL